MNVLAIHELKNKKNGKERKMCVKLNEKLQKQQIKVFEDLPKPIASK